jgi:hypothetical protein
MLLRTFAVCIGFVPQPAGVTGIFKIGFGLRLLVLLRVLFAPLGPFAKLADQFGIILKFGDFNDSLFK